MSKAQALATCLSVLLMGVILSACNRQTVEPYAAPDSSYGLIYNNVFRTTCSLSGCHDGQAESPSLTGENVYASLVNGIPSNGQARDAGLLLIKPFDSDSSFLYQKLAFDSTAFKFGSPMPQGGLTISDHAVTFIKDWIDAGAPELGHVADRSLIE